MVQIPTPTAMATALRGIPVKTAPAAPRILIVDDDVRMARSVQALLSVFNYRLEVVHSAFEALERLCSAEYDLVLLDLRMPGLDGHGAMDLIAEKGIDVTVIVVSGERDIDAAIGAIKRGAYNYLRKPFRPEELLNSVAQAVQKRQMEAERREMQYQLECSERLYRYLMDSLPDIIYTLDPEGNFTYVNDRAQQLLGFEREELVGSHYSRIMHEEDLEKARYVFQERRVGDRASRNVELRLKSSNALAEQRYFENTVLTISFNSTALYAFDEEKNRKELFGTFGVARDITELKRAEQRISYQAYHDVLTDLPNRALFKDRLDLAVIHANRNGSALAVMFVDLDGFKLINDTLGHHKGDQLLQQVAMRMRKQLRGGDTLARVGGDEFTLLLPDTRTQKDAAGIAKKFLWSLEQPFDLDGRDVHLTASIGIAIYPDDGNTMEDLVRHADIAMYQVKTKGKNGFGFYEKSMEVAANYKITLAQTLRHAIEENQLELHYQPQVDFRTGEIVGAEALMRWNHPERGQLPAGDFLPFAEENNLMLPLSAWMIQMVCRDLQKWNAAGKPVSRVSINLSPQCLDRGDTVQKLANAMTRYGIAPAQLEVEITENVCIGNPQQALLHLNKLADMGIGIAIDDFGIGYSSLAYLQRFPVKTLKIDQSFVRDIVDADGHYPVVLAVISIARSIGLNVIAEGVETEIQARYLQRAGCDTMQGFHFYKPLNAAGFDAAINAAARRPAPVTVHI
ncbi:putative bifunctional diguanylate cyclase/phosphodiesterase [Noviherbaspirillum sp.]|uniref:putative bifunctional diguanylate cyclase/phosphodiesterase n=1 Tax=Noviherbaspirillum sp. TaxID=1926288 RepID=UPI002FE20AC0